MLEIVNSLDNFFENRLPEESKQRNKNFEGFRKGDKLLSVPLYGEITNNSEEEIEEDVYYK